MIAGNGDKSDQPVRTDRKYNGKSFGRIKRDIKFNHTRIICNLRSRKKPGFNKKHQKYYN